MTDTVREALIEARKCIPVLLAMLRHEELTPGVIVGEGLLAQVDAALAQPAQPEGWRLVPVEPTEAMLQAGIDTPRMKEVGGVLAFAATRGVQIRDCEPWPLQQAWSAIIAAAPAPTDTGRG